MKKIRVVLKFCISILLLWTLCSKLNVSFDSIRKNLIVGVWLLPVVFIPFIVQPFLSMNRWRLFLRMAGVIENIFSLWRISLLSQFIGLVLPSTQGHDALRMYYISKRHPDCVGAASGSVIIERMFGVLVFCGIALVGLPYVLGHVDKIEPIVFTVVGFTATAVLGVFAVVNRNAYNLYARWRPRNFVGKKIVDFLGATHATLVNFPYRKVMLSSIILILLFQLSTILSVYLLFRAYGIDLPFYMHMAFYPVIAIIAMMPVTIGGFGVREGAFAYFYSLVGVPAEVSVCVSVANYVVLCLLPAALGGVIWLWGCLAGKR